ncbi:sulfatase-like hydrolase/transferase [Dyella tabacisoli]|uniref:Sulfatase n=1 Tax=Dyella tabacisoli TaxID=2282381 RepID=A0A369UJD3_9GAMM|nr:sulfatase-like hydrolase/transferase [Dyella tabacisoli]RDD80651.1 sulfatase [Dyella tabacisoli]
MQNHPFRSKRNNAACLGAAVFFAISVYAAAMQEPAWPQRLFILMLMLCTLGVLVFVFARIAMALVVGGGLFLALKFLSVLKLRYLDSPLIAADFYYYARSSLVETLRHYPHLYALCLGLCVSVPLVLWLAWRWDKRLFAQWRQRNALIVRVGGTVLGAFAFWICMLPSGPFAQAHAKGVWEKLSDDAQLTNFFINMRDSQVQLPPRSSEAVAEQNWADTAHGRPGSLPPPYPDIVQVLEESTFDPSIYTQCSIAQCRVSLFQPDARTRAGGMLRVHTWGGGTWVSEFAALVGMPQDIFGPGGMYAPYVLAPHVADSLPRQLQRLGYLTVAIFPTNGNFLNGRNAYQAYGVDQVYDAEQLGLQEWEETDAQMFQAAKRIYDQVKKPGQPVFLMVLTLQQHGPHDMDPLSSLPAPFNRGLLPKLPTRLALNLSAYLANLQQSDQAMHGLEKDFLDREQPTVLLHFGDHQPSFNSLIRDMPRNLSPELAPYQNYLTYFMLKSNFAGPALPHYPALDIAYLPSMVLQAAGLPADPYFSAATVLRDRCLGVYNDCAVPGLLDSYHGWIFDRLHVYR